MDVKKHFLFGSLVASVCVSHAFQIVSVSPQGEVAQVRKVLVKFDEGAASFGDAKAPAPVAMNCTDAQASKGSGRWINDREWAFEFESDLPPGVSCSVLPLSNLRSSRGTELKSLGSYAFNTGGEVI